MERVLIIDDTKSNIDILLEILGNTYEVLVCLDGYSALQILKEQSVDLILLDIVMPQIDGYEVCRRLKAQTTTKDIPVIFITANTSEDHIETAYNVGGNDYVTKPFKPKELKARIKNQLNLRNLLKKELSFNKQVALSELLHNIAHQWRQPLSSISTLSSGMAFQKKLGLISDEESIEICEKITQITKDLSQTIESFRNLIKKSSLYAEFNLASFIEENYHLLFSEVKDQKIEVNIQVDDQLSLQSYPNQLLQVLMSIITNSKDALKQSALERKIISVHIDTFEDKIRIQIQDNALGIKEELKQSLFEPYTTSHHKSLNKGLGLYVVHNIVTQQLKGSIEVNNSKFEAFKTEQSGALFTLTLPNLNH